MKQTIKLNESQLRHIIRKSIQNTLRESFQNDFSSDECLKMCDIWMQIQFAIEEGKCNVHVNNGSFYLYGTLGENINWRTDDISLNPYDKYSPSIYSENATIYVNDKEIYMGDYDIYDFTDEDLAFKNIWEYCEKKYGEPWKMVINMIGGGGTFPNYILDAIENGSSEELYEKQLQNIIKESIKKTLGTKILF